MATTKVDVNLISATGTASSSTFLRGDSSWNAVTGITIGSETATTSGASVTIGSIASGTKRITLVFEAVSQSGSSEIKLQIGDAGGLETSGYIGASKVEGGATLGTQTAGYSLVESGATGANSWHGSLVLILKDSTNNTWSCTGILAEPAGTELMQHSAGSKSLSAELTQIAIVLNGTTWDAGVINVITE